MVEGGSADASQESKHGSNKTGIIVGVVVGVGGALILAGLALWLFRRLKTKKRSAESQTGVAPYVVSEKELYRTASWSPHNADDPTAAANAEPRRRNSDEERPPRRIVREQDAEEYEVLPPLYREWQTRPGPSEGEPYQPHTPPLEQPVSIAPGGSDDRNAEPSSLKDDYVRALGSSAGPSSGISTPQPNAALKDHAAADFETGDVKRPIEAPQTSSAPHTIRRSDDVPLSPTMQQRRVLPELPRAGTTDSARAGAAPAEGARDLAGDYKRAFL